MSSIISNPEVKYVPVYSDRAWFDPRLMLAACEQKTRDVAVPMFTNFQIAVADPLRVAIGFCAAPGVFGSISIGPWPDPNLFSYFNTNLQTAAWVTVRDNLTLPTSEWWASAAAGATLRVIEIRRLA